MTDNPQEIELTSTDEIVQDDLEKQKNGSPGLSELAYRVLIAAQMDYARGDEVYSPEKAAKGQPWEADELEEACEELVEANEFRRDGDSFRLSDN